MKVFKKRITSALLALTLLLLLPVQAWAALGPIETARETSLTVEYLVEENISAPGVEFKLYRVADVSAEMEFTLTGEFANYAGQVSLEVEETEEWETLANTLKGCVLADQISPQATGKTDANGALTFSGLKTGLYLVIGGQYVRGRTTYTAAPFLVSLPESNEYGTAWNYAVTVHPKYAKYTDPGGDPDKTVVRKVHKRWDDADDPSARPAQVVVDLLCGSRKITVTLDESNRWEHTWNVRPGEDWTVWEHPVPGYTVTVRQHGATYLVTNTIAADVPGPDDPDAPDNPDNPDNPNKPDNPNNPDNPSNPNNPGGTKLPQTGVLWWPVPVLLAAGLMLLIVGCVRRRADHGE